LTLRLRLVVAIVVLVTAGLVLFGVTTYSLYAKSQYQGLDNQLRNSELVVSGSLRQLAGPSTGPGGSYGDGDDGGGGDVPGGSGPEPGGQGGTPPVFVPPFGVLYGQAGKQLAHLPVYSTTASRPKLPAGCLGPKYLNQVFTTGSVTGKTLWRVLVFAVPGPGDEEIVVATPTTDVTEALNRLVLIETGGALALLVLISIGCWLVLRRGLRPLEHMAETARAISGGDLSQRVTPLAASQGEVGQLGLAFNTMLSDIEAAFAERDATEAKLRQFLADASHELRTPLTSIQGFAELSRLGAADARRGEAPALDSATAMRRIEEQAGRMRMLVEELLLLARLDRIREAARVPVDLTVLAADACSEAAALAPHRRISLQGPLPVVVLGDETHLRQAIANLVTNAIRHTPDDTPIEVSSMSSASVGTVEVRDHGEGLDSAGLVHAFDRFWRSDRSRASTGTGLGLSIVAAVAAEHGGRAEVANAPQGGAVFTLVIPAAPLSE